MTYLGESYALSVGVLFEPKGGQLLVEKNCEGNRAQETRHVKCKSMRKLLRRNQVSNNALIQQRLKVFQVASLPL